MNSQDRDWNSILIARLSAIGDIVFALPVLTSLRRARPDLKIDWLVDDRTSALLRDHPWIDELIIYPRSRLRGWWKHPLRSARLIHAHRRELRSRSYDFALELQGNLKCALQLRQLEGARRIGFARVHTRERWSTLFTDEQIDPGAGRIHRIDKFLSLLRPLGIPAQRDFPPPPHLPQRALEQAEHIAARARRSGGPLIAMHPFVSGYGRDKQWPIERFAALARSLTRDLGAYCHIVRGPAEDASTRELVERSEASAHDDMPRGDLRDLLAVLLRADLFVGCDSGPLHLASWMQTPCVALFGPTDPQVYGPVHAAAILLYHGKNPPPARQRSRPCEAMARIEVAEALAACRRLLAGD